MTSRQVGNWFSVELLRSPFSIHFWMKINMNVEHPPHGIKIRDYSDYNMPLTWFGDCSLILCYLYECGISSLTSLPCTAYWLLWLVLPWKGQEGVHGLFFPLSELTVGQGAICKAKKSLCEAYWPKLPFVSTQVRYVWTWQSKGGSCSNLCYI